MGKQKTPGDIPLGLFWFPGGKLKTPGAIHNLNQSKIWLAPGVFCFPWGKQKIPGNISPGDF